MPHNREFGTLERATHRLVGQCDAFPPIGPEMRLKEHLLQLPVRFAPAALIAEVEALPESAWVPHPNKLPGNEAALLVTTNGEFNDDTASPMAPTDFLRTSPAIMAVMAAIGATWGRSRLMRLAPGAVVPPHVDTNFYWRTHVRIHVPIITTPDVLFTVEGRSVHMRAGECWIFDTFSRHRVENGGARSRTHLVLDTVGGEGLSDLIEQARDGCPMREISLRPDAAGANGLMFERSPTKMIMSPWELRYHIDFIGEIALPDPVLGTVMKRLRRLVSTWASVWACYGSTQAGVGCYLSALGTIDADLAGLDGAHLRLRNNLPMYDHIAELLRAIDATMDHAQPISAQSPQLRSVG